MNACAKDVEGGCPVRQRHCEVGRSLKSTGAEEVEGIALRSRFLDPGSFWRKKGVPTRSCSTFKTKQSLLISKYESTNSPETLNFPLQSQLLQKKTFPKNNRMTDVCTQLFTLWFTRGKKENFLLQNFESTQSAGERGDAGGFIKTLGISRVEKIQSGKCCNNFC